MAKETPRKKRFYVLADLLEIFPYHPVTITKMVREQRLPTPYKMGNRNCWPVEEIESIVEQLKAKRDALVAKRQAERDALVEAETPKRRRRSAKLARGSAE